MPDESKIFDRRETCPPAAAQRPFHWIELRDRAEVIEATEAVPDKLCSLWSNLAVRSEAAVQSIKKGAGDHPLAMAPHRPNWMASAIRPTAAPRRTRPGLTHRGVAVEPLLVWGADDRRTYDDMRFPWVCVCHISAGGSFGSGVLVGPRHVLTASHVVNWGGEAETIEVHRAGGRVAATARAIKRWAFTRVPGGIDGGTVDEDYAVLIVDQPLGERFGWMGVRTYDSGWDDESLWWNIGYAGDVASGQFPIWQKNKKLDEDEFDYGSGRAMTTAADVMPRQSGSPMFGFWPDGPYVVAVVSAVGNIFLSGDENWCAGGSDLTRLVRHARATDP